MKAGGRSPLGTVDLVIEGKVLLGGVIREAAIAIDSGRIVSVSSAGLAPKSEEKAVYTGKRVVMPGMVDIHVHMRDLGQSHKEEWYTGSLSALRGGVTTVVDMPNNEPFIDTPEKARMKAELASNRSLVDFGFYIGYPKQPKELGRLGGLVLGVKLYPQDLYEQKLRPLFEECSKLGLPVIVHPEDPVVLRNVRRKLGVREIDSVSVHTLIRPREAEITAIRRVLALCREYRDLRVHFTHVSTKDSVELVCAAKANFRASFDITPHHTFLDESVYLGPYRRIAKVNPPLRSRKDREFLFDCLRRLVPDALVTDHAPHTLEEKLAASYEDIPPGFPGLETALPLLLTKVIEGALPLRVIELYSSRPADLMALAKGRIEVGYDADIIVVDYNKEYIIKGGSLASKAKFTPFEGWRVRGKVTDVYLRGVKVLEDGDPLVSAGFGRLVRRFESGVSWDKT